MKTFRFKLRQASYLRLSDGGYAHGYDVLDGSQKIGVKLVVKQKDAVHAYTSWSLNDGRMFLDAAAFLAAYEGRDQVQPRETVAP